MLIDFDKYPLPKRLRHHTAPNLYLPANELKVITNSYPPLIDSINWGEVFINGLPPNWIDVGCGKGKLLFDLSNKYPEINILGIELRRSLTEWIATIINGEQILNVGVLWYSVINGIRFVSDNSIDKIFYLFPDPWSKRKHKKRRALNLDSLDEYHRVLTPGGMLYLATDVPEVHEDHLKELQIYGKFKFSLIDSDSEWLLPATNKETFCRLNNIEFFRIICTK